MQTIPTATVEHEEQEPADQNSVVGCIDTDDDIPLYELKTENEQAPPVKEEGESESQLECFQSSDSEAEPSATIENQPKATDATQRPLQRNLTDQFDSSMLFGPSPVTGDIAERAIAIVHFVT